MSNTPQWAQELAEQVCKEHHRRVPTINWRQSEVRTWTSGRTWRGRVKGEQFYKLETLKNGKRRIRKDMGRIAITAGTRDKDQRLVLLHELAHWVTGHKHTRKFWDKAFDLYARYGVDMDYALEREKVYREGASLAFARRLK